MSGIDRDQVDLIMSQDPLGNSCSALKDDAFQSSGSQLNLNARSKQKILLFPVFVCYCHFCLILLLFKEG